MIGQKSIEINWTNFTKGHTTGDTTTDGGFSIGVNPSDGIQASVINPIVQPGVLNFPASPTDKSANLLGVMIASCEDPAGNAHRLFISSRTGSTPTEANAGRYYSCDSAGTLTLQHAVDTTQTYIVGKTDLIGFQGEAYVTSSTYIQRWQQPGTINLTFLQFTSSLASSAPHPALVFEQNAFFADGNQLWRMNVAGTPPTVILTLSSGQVITALGIDPGSGKMLISIVSQFNISDTIPSVSMVGYYNGYSNKLDKIVIVDDMITAFYPVGGTIFITYGSRFGYWTGAGISFLRKLNVSYDNSELIYKCKITNIGEVVYIAEKNRILAYGEVILGQGKRFWYCLENIPVNNLSFVTNLGSNSSTAQNLAYSFNLNSAGVFDLLDTMSIASRGTGQIFTLSYDFSRPVTFDNFVIEYVSNITASTDIGQVFLGTDYTDIAAVQIATVNTGTKVTTTFECPYPVAETRTIQVNYQAIAQLPIKRFTIFYTPKD